MKSKLLMLPDEVVYSLCEIAYNENLPGHSPTEALRVILNDDLGFSFPSRGGGGRKSKLTTWLEGGKVGPRPTSKKVRGMWNMRIPVEYIDALNEVADWVGENTVTGTLRKIVENHKRKANV